MGNRLTNSIKSPEGLEQPRVRTDKLKKFDDHFEPRTDLDQPVVGLPVLTAN